MSTIPVSCCKCIACLVEKGAKAAGHPYQTLFCIQLFQFCALKALDVVIPSVQGSARSHRSGRDDEVDGCC